MATTILDANQVLKKVYDEPTESLKTNTTVVATIGDVTVDVSHTDDSIRLGDGTDLVTTTTEGGNVGLDVNIINPSLPVNSISVPTISNESITSANTEQSFVFPSGTKKFLIKIRENSSLKLAYISGQSGTNYITIPPGNIYEINNLNLSSSLTIYFQSSKGSQTLEIEYWS